MKNSAVGWRVVAISGFLRACAGHAAQGGCLQGGAAASRSKQGGRSGAEKGERGTGGVGARQGVHPLQHALAGEPRVGGGEVPIGQEARRHCGAAGGGEGSAGTEKPVSGAQRCTLAHPAHEGSKRVKCQALDAVQRGERVPGAGVRGRTVAPPGCAHPAAASSLRQRTRLRSRTPAAPRCSCLGARVSGTTHASACPHGPILALAQAGDEGGGGASQEPIANPHRSGRSAGRSRAAPQARGPSLRRCREPADPPPHPPAAAAALAASPAVPPAAPARPPRRPELVPVAPPPLVLAGPARPAAPARRPRRPRCPLARWHQHVRQCSHRRRLLG